jgi:glycosyltransferase involved in cell wall biosynthesis
VREQSIQCNTPRPSKIAAVGNQYRFLWLEGIFDENTVSSFTAISPAANFYQRGYVDALHKLGHGVDVIGYPVERVWPFGRLIIRGEQASLSPGLTGQVIGYANPPLLRNTIQYINLLKVAKSHLRMTKHKPDYQIIWSCLDKSTDETPAIRVAKYIRKHFGVPWVCIVADGAIPPGADAYVYQAWSHYKSDTSPGPSIHIDGGIPDVKCEGDPNLAIDSSKQEKALMYMGALTEHGGVSQLARAFHKLKDKDIQLWVCGRGSNSELKRLAEVDQRIKIKGFVDEVELSKLASAAFAFANPRPNSFAPNKLNYPSKVLHYLAYGKPVISTFTDGLSPDYADVLIQMREDSDSSLGEAIHNVLNMHSKEYEDMRDRIANFNKTHTWIYQVNRFVSWLQNQVH